MLLDKGCGYGVEGREVRGERHVRVEEGERQLSVSGLERVARLPQLRLQQVALRHVAWLPARRDVRAYVRRVASLLMRDAAEAVLEQREVGEEGEGGVHGDHSTRDARRHARRVHHRAVEQLEPVGEQLQVG